MSHNKRGIPQKARKLVVVGDGMSGKTCLLFAFKDDLFYAEHVPTVFETYVTEIELDGKIIELGLYDTAGQEDFDRLRPLSYPETNVVLICFAVDNAVSVSSVRERWAPEIRHFCERCPVILVACKIDLRTDSKTISRLKRNGEKVISTETGRHLAEQIKADSYMECSAKTREGVQELFRLAAQLSLKKSSYGKKVRQCSMF